MTGNHQVLALLLSRLTVDEERMLRRSVSRSSSLLRFCEEAFRHRESGADWILTYGHDGDRPLSRESTRKLSERLLSHVFQVLAASPGALESGHNGMDAAHASECVKCGVFIVQTLGNRGVPARWLMNYLEKRADLCRSFGLVEDLVAVHFQRWHMSQQLASPGAKATEPEGVYRDLMKATENMRFMVETEQYLFHHLEESGNCFLLDNERLNALERKVAEITLFNNRNRFVFLSFTQLVLQSRIFFARGDCPTGLRLVGEAVSLAGEFSEVAYRLRNSPYGINIASQGVSSGNNNSSTASAGRSILMQFPRFYGLLHEPVILDLFYRREFDPACELCLDFLPAAGSEQSGQFPVRWYVILGFVHFMRGELRRAAQMSRSMDSAPDGRSSWGLGFRLLSIYISLENGTNDLAMHQIESLRKFMERHQRIRAFSARENLILRLLSSLSRADFDYRKVVAANPEAIELLASEKPEYTWRPGGYELIAFHEWLRGKAETAPV